MGKKMCSDFGKGVPDSKKKDFTEAVADAKYYCPKCGRVANDADKLCKDKKIKSKTGKKGKEE